MSVMSHICTTCSWKCTVTCSCQTELFSVCSWRCYAICLLAANRVASHFTQQDHVWRNCFLHNLWIIVNMALQ